jgi:hypothetical protein
MESKDGLEIYVGTAYIIRSLYSIGQSKFLGESRYHALYQAQEQTKPRVRK